MNKNLLLNKLESLDRCLKRIEDKTPDSVEKLKNDLDLQDIIVLNLERAIQNSVDIGLHILSTQKCNLPQNMAQTFELLCDLKIIDKNIAKKLKKSVGFRNTAVHTYQQLDWEIVYQIATRHLEDFKEFARQIIKAAEIEL
ncbi:MAG: type VII toxin-antitoxin system HepT family RNase toxin [Candidatus Rifleibacteriota bacterium]